MKTQFQSAEIMQVRFPAFYDKVADAYVTGGVDICTVVARKPDGSTATYNDVSSPAVTWDSITHTWILNIPTGSFLAGLWRMKASSNAANTFPQWESYHWGDYVDDITLGAKILEGRWKVEGTQLLFYERDGTTVLRTFALRDETGSPSITRIFERLKL